MAITPPPQLDQYTNPAPIRNERATFSGRVDTFVTWLIASVSQFSALALNVKNNATEAFDAAQTAIQKRNEASDLRDETAGLKQTAVEAAATANAAAQAAATSMVTSTSTTNLAIGAGSKVFVTQAGKQFSVGVPIVAVSAANPAKYMFGVVAAYGGTSLEINVGSVGGTGSAADWNISVSGIEGKKGDTGSVDLAGNASGGLNELKGPDIASAATTMDIWTATQGNVMTVTGTTATTAFPAAPRAGAKRTLVATGAWPLTHSANFILPGAANYTCAAGDRVEVVALTTTQFRLTIHKADGTAVIGGGMRSGIATIDPLNTTITLTAASAFLQIIRPDYFSGRIVKLPAANLLTAGVAAFAVQNNSGRYAARVTDNANNLIGFVMPMQRIIFTPVDVSNAAGKWTAEGSYEVNRANVFPASNVRPFQVAQNIGQVPTLTIDEMYSVALFTSGGSDAYLALLKQGETPDVITNSTGAGSMQYIGVSATPALSLMSYDGTYAVIAAFWIYNGGSTYMAWYQVNVTTGQWTFLTNRSVISTNMTEHQVFQEKMTASRVIVQQIDNQGYPIICAFEWGGGGTWYNTPTYQLGVVSGIDTCRDLAVLSSTVAVVAYGYNKVRVAVHNDSSSNAAAFTLGTEVTVNENIIGLCRYSASSVMIFVLDSAGALRARIGTVTGNSISIGGLSAELVTTTPTHTGPLYKARVVAARDGKAFCYWIPQSQNSAGWWAREIIFVGVTDSGGVPILAGSPAVYPCNMPLANTRTPSMKLANGIGHLNLLTYVNNTNTTSFLARVALA